MQQVAGSDAARALPGPPVTATKVEVRGVTKEFPTKAGAFTAIANVDLEVNDGELVSLIGPSGCGKSTLLELIAGLQEPSEGQVTVDGRRVTGPGPERAVVFQHYALFPWRNVVDNVAFSLELSGVSKRDRREHAREFLELVGLEPFADHYIWQLSGGMRQRVGLARALCCDPDVLLMDEPFGALDAITRDVLQDHLQKIREETRRTIVFVTHSVDEALFLSDRIAVMGTKPGRILEVFELGFDRGRGREVMRADAEYARLHARIWELLSEEITKSEMNGRHDG